MLEETSQTAAEERGPWTQVVTAKQRTAVRHALSHLLDDLAPVGAPPRGAARPPARVERLRFPTGCILQADTSALSVSWFPATDADSEHGEYGELVVIVWRGVVSRPGSARREPLGAVVLRQLAWRPVEVAPSVWGWRGANDAVCDGVALAAQCRELLEDALVA